MRNAPAINKTKHASNTIYIRNHKAMCGMRHKTLSTRKYIHVHTRTRTHTHTHIIYIYERYI